MQMSTEISIKKLLLSIGIFMTLNLAPLEPFWADFSVLLIGLLPNLYKTITLGTMQKWLSWTGTNLTKHLLKMTTSQMYFY